MLVTLPLNKMSIEEKIKTMEAIWDDLCKNEDAYASPSWHENILHERENSILKGDDKFTDWGKAKKDIRDKTS